MPTPLEPQQYVIFEMGLTRVVRYNLVRKDLTFNVNRKFSYEIFLQFCLFTKIVRFKLRQNTVISFCIVIGYH